MLKLWEHFSQHLCFPAWQREARLWEMRLSTMPCMWNCSFLGAPSPVLCPRKDLENVAFSFSPTQIIFNAFACGFGRVENNFGGWGCHYSELI